MTERMRSVRDRLDRADEHIETIKRLLREHFSGDACNLTGQFDPNSGEGLRVAGTVDMPPMRVFTVIGECLHNVRSAFDHLASMLVVGHGGTPDEKTAFPMHAAIPTPNKKGISKPPSVSGGVSEAAHALVVEMQPYQWGSHNRRHPLFRLSRLSNEDKHRNVVLRTLQFGSVVNSRDYRPVSGRLTKTGVLDDGAEFALVPDDPTVQVNATLALRLHLGEPEPGEQAPVIDTLSEIVEFARLAVGRFSTLPEMAPIDP